jgi:hypothetical protein
MFKFGFTHTPGNSFLHSRWSRRSFGRDWFPVRTNVGRTEVDSLSWTTYGSDNDNGEKLVYAKVDKCWQGQYEKIGLLVLECLGKKVMLKAVVVWKYSTVTNESDTSRMATSDITTKDWDTIGIQLGIRWMRVGGITKLGAGKDFDKDCFRS